MIALNEILTNKNKFDEKYKLMGKHFNLDKIVALEQKFILIDKQNNNLRADCNKLCSQVAELIKNNLPTNELLKQINSLDKKINHDENLTKKYYSKINKLLSKLPNLPIDNNTLNIEIKTNKNQNYNFNMFTTDLNKFANIEDIKCSTQKYLKNLSNVVFEDNNLTKIVKNNHEILILAKTEYLDLFDKIINIIQNNANFLIHKSIKRLPFNSQKGYFAELCDNTKLNIELIGEFESRNNMIKFHSNNEDMTKFVNIISIKY